MPAPGAQHTSIANPFEDQPPKVSEYTAQQIATLQSRLEKQLGPEYLSSRAGPSGTKVHYITAEKVIALANEIFGFNGWSSSIQNIQVDFCDESPQTLRVSLGLSVIVRVTLRDGTYHEDLGYGHIENCKGKAAAFEKAKKEGTTDALKRALRHFGNVLGNCIYDKTYLGKVTKMKAAPAKWDENCLHRHPDFAVKTENGAGPVKTEAAAITAPPAATGAAPTSGPVPPTLTSEESMDLEDFFGELDEADFNIPEEDHPDEVSLPASTTTSTVTSNGSTGNHNNQPMQPPARPLARTGSGNAGPGGNNFQRQPPQAQQPHTPNPPRGNAFVGAQNNGPTGGMRPPANQFNQNKPPAQPNNQQPPRPPGGAGPPPQPTTNAATAPQAGEPIGFFSARAVSRLPEDVINAGQVTPKADLAFNPRFESPSIRKTPGIDHTKSKPVSRTGQHVPPVATQSDGNDKAPPTRPGPPGQMPRPGPPLARPNPNITNPHLDQTRRIGFPGSSSPLANRSQYRPPTIVKRPADGSGPPNGREPLGDRPNNTTVNAGGMSGPDAKRPRIA